MSRPLRVTSWTEPKALSEVVKYEADQAYTRDTGTIVSGAGVVTLGRVLGQISVGSASAAAKSGGNTGTGALTLDGTTPVKAGAKVGVYSVRCTAAATNGGTFEVKDPDGFVLGSVAVGATFDNDLKFSIADGGTDFVAGDGFDITVAAGSSKWTSYNPAGNNGSEIAAGVLLTGSIDATSDDKPEAVILTRGPATVALQELNWGSGVTTQAHKDAAIADLKRAGIIARVEA